MIIKILVVFTLGLCSP